MTTKYGVFTDTTHGIGEPFADKVKPDPRDKGLNFKVATCKEGKLNDACFDKLKPLYAGEPFVEPLKSALQQKNASKKKNVTEKAWKMASPMKESACPGDWCGTLQGKVLPYVAGTVEVKLKKGEVKGTPSNIKAGLCNTAAIRQQQARGITGEYEYIADPIHQATRQRSAAGAPTVVPFKPGNPPKKGGPGTTTRNFLGRAKGAVGEFEWRARPDMLDQTSSSTPGAATAAAEDAPPAAAAAAAAQHTGSFKPAAFPHKGPLATFNRFPEYLHDPETLKTETRRQQLAKEHGLLAAHAGGAWRPGGQVKTDATRSIMRMNL